MTSGALYCLVFIIDEWCSWEKVAPPKSIILINGDLGTKNLFFNYFGFLYKILPFYYNKIFSGYIKKCYLYICVSKRETMEIAHLFQDLFEKRLNIFNRISFKIIRF